MVSKPSPAGAQVQVRLSLKTNPPAPPPAPQIGIRLAVAAKPVRAPVVRSSPLPYSFPLVVPGHTVTITTETIGLEGEMATAALEKVKPDLLRCYACYDQPMTVEVKLPAPINALPRMPVLGKGQPMETWFRECLEGTLSQVWTKGPDSMTWTLRFDPGGEAPAAIEKPRRKPPM